MRLYKHVQKVNYDHLLNDYSRGLSFKIGFFFSEYTKWETRIN